MTQFDFTPLFRVGIGFDRLASLAEAAARLGEPAQSYPPYNIEKTGDEAWTITLAVAGFGEDDLDVQIDRDLLTIRGAKTSETVQNEASENGHELLYRGIAARDFLRRFQLADHVKVVAATLENGLLTIALQREVPEAEKPRKIAIARQSGPQTAQLEAHPEAA